MLAALRGTRVGLADNWLRHVRTCGCATASAWITCHEAEREDALCEMNVIEQVGNVALTTVHAGCLGRGQQVAVHGWVYGLRDGLLSRTCR